MSLIVQGNRPPFQLPSNPNPIGLGLAGLVGSIALAKSIQTMIDPAPPQAVRRLNQSLALWGMAIIIGFFSFRQIREMLWSGSGNSYHKGNNMQPTGFGKINQVQPGSNIPLNQRITQQPQGSTLNSVSNTPPSDIVPTGFGKKLEVKQEIEIVTTRFGKPKSGVPEEQKITYQDNNNNNNNDGVVSTGFGKPKSGVPEEQKITYQANNNNNNDGVISTGFGKSKSSSSTPANQQIKYAGSSDQEVQKTGFGKKK